MCGTDIDTGKLCELGAIPVYFTKFYLFWDGTDKIFPEEILGEQVGRTQQTGRRESLARSSEFPLTWES